MADAKPFEIKIEGRLLEQLPKAGAFGDKTVYDALGQASGYVWQKSIENAPKSDGILAQSIRRDLNPHFAKIGPTVKYAAYLHGDPNSSATHSEPHYIPVREAQAGGTLYRWATKHGMNPYAVRAAIAKRGTKFQPFLTRTLKETEGDVQKYFEAALEKIANFLAK